MTREARWIVVASLAAAWAEPRAALAEDARRDYVPAASAPAPPAGDAAPLTAYTFSAFGARAGAVGASAFGTAVANGNGTTALGGGARAWGSPIDRLTLLGQASTDPLGRFAPSASAIVRLGGGLASAWALSAIGTYKAEGFDEAGGEAEGGLLASFARARWHGDVNALAGGGLEEREMDAEARVRGGYDVTAWLRTGVDGQMRARVAGAGALAGGRAWDATGGPQVVAALGPVFGAVTVGPTTVGVDRGVGWGAMVTVGAGRF